MISNPIADLITEQVVKQIARFLAGDQDVLLIKGISGAGKTSLISKIVSLDWCYEKKWVVMAPTGSGVVDIQKYNPEIPAETIHQVIYTLVEQADRVGLYRKFAVRSDLDFDLYIVDSASEIHTKDGVKGGLVYGSGNVLADLITASKVKKKAVKIIIMGDPCKYTYDKFAHLESLSEEYYQKNNLSVMSMNLTNMLNCSVQLENYIDTLLKCDENDIPEPIKILDKNIPVRITKYLNSDADLVTEFLKGDIANQRIITPSNPRVKKYNQLIRKARNFSNQVEKGDYLVISQNLYKIPLKFNNKRVFKYLYKGQLLKIVKVDKKVKVHKYKNIALKFIPILFKLVGYNDDACYSTYLLENSLINDELYKNQLYMDLWQYYKNKYPDDYANFLENNRKIENNAEHKKHDARSNEYFKEAEKLLKELNITLPTLDKNKIKELIKENPEADPRNYCRRRMYSDLFKKLLETSYYYNCITAHYGYATNEYWAIANHWEKVFVDLDTEYDKTKDLAWVYSTISRSTDQLLVINE